MIVVGCIGVVGMAAEAPLVVLGEEFGNVDVIAMKRRHVLCGRMIFMTSRLIAS